MTIFRGRLLGRAVGGFAGYRVVATYQERYGDTAAAGGQPPPSTQREVPVFVAGHATSAVEEDGRFSLTLPDVARLRFPVEIEAFAPNGIRVGSADLDEDALQGGRELRLEVEPSPVFEIETHPDPNLGLPDKLSGRVIDLSGRRQAAGAQMILWAKRNDNEPPQPVLTATTDRAGYFSGPRPQGRFTSAFATVAVGRGQSIVIALEDAEFPKQVVLGIEMPDGLSKEGEDCACGTDVPRAPDAEDLTLSAQTYSQDLVGGQCVTFTVPNRTLEEFSYFQVVRTTEPDIQGLTVRPDGPRVPASVVTAFLPATTRTAMARTADVPITRALKPDVLKALATDPERIDASTLVRAEQNTAFADLRNVLQKFGKRAPGRAPLTSKNQVDWDDEPTFYQATSIAHGHILNYKQVWKADGYSLGDLLYSLPLAPCQKKQIAVIDWERREIAARTEEVLEAEQLQAALTRDRDISEIVNSSVNEQTRGGSTASTWAAGGGLGLAIGPLVLGAAGGGGGASSTAWQNSSRDLAASSLQQLRDSTMQAASAVRGQRSTVVQTARQGESMRVTTEVVANHNHCHAITVEYFEVLRHFRVEHQLTDVQECLFIPLPIALFDFAKALRWRQALSTFLREPSLRRGFDAIERITNSYDGSDFPPGRYSEEPVRSMDGEMRMTFSIARPPDHNDDYDPAAWSAIGILTGRPPDYWYNAYLRGQQLKDRVFREEVAPRIAEAFVDALRFSVRVGSANQTVTFDPTLVSRYAENVPLFVNLSSDGSIPNIRREDITGFNVTTTQVLPPYSRVMVNSVTVRYRTDSMSGWLVREGQALNDLSVSDSVQLGVFLSHDEKRNPRQEDREAARKLIDHLNEHLEYYHKVLWMTMDAERRYMLFDGYVAPNSGNRSVASVVENRLIGIVGNSLVMPVARGFHLDPTFSQDDDEPVDLLNHYAPTTPIPPTRVSVPTRGVFAEAVMGSCNSCEVKDDTRFWRFEESPCGDEPTAIEPVSTASRRAEPPDLTAKDLPTPIINLQNAPAAPDPTGLAAALKVIATPNLFKDITGLEGNQKNALAAFNSVMDTAKFFGGEASKLAMQKTLDQGMDKTLSQIKKAKEDGLIDEGQANEITHNALQGLVGEDRGSKPKLTDSADVKKLLQSAATSGKSNVSLSRGTEAVSVKRTPERTFDVKISGTIAPLAQPQPNTCWAAVTTMMKSWRDGVSRTIPDTMDLLGGPWRAKFEAEQTLLPEDKIQLLAAAGLEGEPPMSFSVDAMKQLIETYGPLWVTTDEDPTEKFSLHARVATGIFGDGTPAGTFLRLIDPNGGKDVVERFDIFTKKFEEEAQAAGSPTRIQVVHFPK